MHRFEIDNKITDIFYKEAGESELPVIILNAFGDEGIKVWEECQRLNTKDFILVSVSISETDWNDNMTPWEAPPLYKNDGKYLGYADKYLRFLEKEIIPVSRDYIKTNFHKKIEYLGIAGYSLGGLFALYAGYKTDIFKRIVSASGSLWYPNLAEYIKENKISKNIDKIYFSLGNKEAMSKHRILKTVKEKTISAYEHLNKNINAIFEENEGNHFKNTALRTAKGIKWILE